MSLTLCRNALVLALGLTGCARQKAEAIVREGLTDPDSAKFDVMSISHDGEIACGTVNSKNVFGGYSGSKTFMVLNGRVRFVGPGEQFADLADCCYSALSVANGFAPDQDLAKTCKRLTPVVVLGSVAKL